MATLRLLAIAIGISLVQAIALQVFPEKYFYPDLVLVFALAMGLRSEGVSGLVLAFGIGFLVDVGITTGGQPGLYALLRGTACGLTRIFDRALYLRGGLPWALYVAGYVVLDSLLLGLVTNTWRTTGALEWADILKRTPGVALATAVFAAPLLRLFRRIDPTSGSDTGWGLLGSRIG
jgi:rod shape-determining protein MreD